MNNSSVDDPRTSVATSSPRMHQIPKIVHRGDCGEVAEFIFRGKRLMRLEGGHAS